MRLGRFEISKWEHSVGNKEFIVFEYMHEPCDCYFLTILNILFVFYSKECKKELTDQDNKDTL